MSILENKALLNYSGELSISCALDIKEEQYLGIFLPKKLEKAVASRKIEFQKGRYLAQELLLGYGCKDIVAVGDNREPLWPDGFVGSISHCRSFYVAAVAKIDQATAVGLDIEEVGRIKPELCRMIRTHDDVVESFLSDDILNTLIFSAKESLYKMLFPQVKIFFGFKDASIIEIDGNSFCIKLNKTLSDQHIAGNSYSGRFIWNKRFVLTYLEY